MNDFVIGVQLFFFYSKVTKQNKQTKKIKEKLHIDIFRCGKSNQQWVSKYDNTPVTVYKNTNELYINSVTAWHILQKKQFKQKWV